MILKFLEYQLSPHTLSLSKGLNVRKILLKSCIIRTQETLRQAQGVRILGRAAVGELWQKKNMIGVNLHV